MSVKTVVIESENGPVIINESDFNPSIHKLANTDSELMEKVADTLRTDGPTVEEFVAAGYRAENYPPQGYESRSTAGEIASAIQAQEPPAVPPVPDKADMLVTKQGKVFVVVDKEQNAIEREGIDGKGYKTEAEAWAAVMALSA